MNKARTSEGWLCQDGTTATHRPPSMRPAKHNLRKCSRHLKRLNPQHKDLKRVEHNSLLQKT